MPRVLSCIQPTGSVHLGNYLGALVNWVSGQHDGDVFHGIVDLHALTVTDTPDVLGQQTIELAAMLFAVGLDPEVATVFVQSHIHEHTELAWIMECTVSFGELSRMTQFKDKAAKRESDFVSAGLFTYPALQAADILLYDAEEVPVGDDQRQHIEITRDIAIRFNHRFGDTLVLPKAVHPKAGARVMDLQDPTSKMSKSSGSAAGVLELMDTPEANTKKIKSAATDAGREVTFDEKEKPGISNLLTIHSSLSGTSIADLENQFAGKGYGDFKTAVAEVVVEHFRPIRAKAMELLEDEKHLIDLLHEGAEKARAVASVTLQDTYKNLGLVK